LVINLILISSKKSIWFDLIQFDYIQVQSIFYYIIDHSHSSILPNYEHVRLTYHVPHQGTSMHKFKISIYQSCNHLRLKNHFRVKCFWNTFSCFYFCWIWDQL